MSRCSPKILLPLMLLSQLITGAFAEKMTTVEAKIGEEVLIGSHTSTNPTTCVSVPAKKIEVLVNPQFGTVNVRPTSSVLAVNPETNVEYPNCRGKTRNYLAIYYKALVADKATDFVRVKYYPAGGPSREEAFRIELNPVRLGIGTQPVRQEIANEIGLGSPHGVMVTDTDKGSAAMAAGIVAGDIVLAINGDRINGNDELHRKVSALGANDTVDVTIWRDRAEKHIAVKLGNGGVQQNSSAGAAAAPQPQAQPSVRDTQAPKINAPKPLND